MNFEPMRAAIPMKNPILNLLRSLTPSLSIGAISADLMNLGADIALLEKAGARLLHFDIMDGHFAPMLTVGPSFVKAVKTSMLKDVHLMIDNPLDTLADYAAAGADLITVHGESCRHPHRALQRISELKNANDQNRGIARGIALNPSTPVSALEPVIDEADIVFLVAVNPGFGGQKFIDATVRRAAAVREMIAKVNHPVLLGIDGGVTKATIARVAETGADIVVTGSAVFEGRAIAGNYGELQDKLRKRTLSC